MVSTDNGCFEIEDWTEWWKCLFAGVSRGIYINHGPTGKCRCGCTSITCNYCIHECFEE